MQTVDKIAEAIYEERKRQCGIKSVYHSSKQRLFKDYEHHDERGLCSACFHRVFADFAGRSDLGIL